MTGGPILDTDQQRVASAPADALQIVIAGPGAGKSEVVGARCRELLTHDVYPEEILVISFSNAAVDVVRARTVDVVDEGRGVDCATIDSLAARVRLELEDGEPRFQGFDRAVERATRLMEDADEPVFPDVRHVIVDEVQDVAGGRVPASSSHSSRRGYTTASASRCSATPCRASSTSRKIPRRERRTRRSLNSSVSGSTSRPLSSRVSTEPGRPRRVRSRTSVHTLRVLPTRTDLMRLRDLSADLPPLGELDEDAVDDVAAWSGSTALLCDTNARAGLVAARFAEYGLPVELAAAATDPTVTPWVGALLGGHEASTIAFDEFEAMADHAQVGDPHGTWRILMRIARSSRDLDLRALATGLATRRIPPELLRVPASDVVASTVHRAKGREFENVVLVDPEAWFSERDDDGPSARRLFVAMSRARSRITRGRGVQTRLWRKDSRWDLWRQTSPRGRGTLGVILEPRHARHLGPVGHDVAAAGRAAVEWTHTDDIITVDSDALPSWTASVDGVPVARTGEEFGRMVRSLSFGDRVPQLVGGRVEGMETVVGTARDDGPGLHGMWVGARVSGPVVFDWE